MSAQANQNKKQCILQTAELIFADRSSLYKRFQQVQKPGQLQSSQEQPPNKFEVFRHRLAAYVQGDKQKVQDSTNSFMFWNILKVNKNCRLRRQERVESRTPSHERIESKDKQGILNYLKSTSTSTGAVSRKKSLQEDRNGKSRLHGSNELSRRKKGHGRMKEPVRVMNSMGQLDRKGCLPVCTINFINYKHNTQASTLGKTVYNNYLAQKLGNTEPAYLDQRQQPARPNCPNTQNQRHSPNVTGIQFHPGSNVCRLPEVIILERSQRDESNSVVEDSHQSRQVDDRKGEEDLPIQSGASLMLAQSKRLWQSRRKSMNIRLNRMTDSENEVSPWSKTKAVEEQENHFQD